LSSDLGGLRIGKPQVFNQIVIYPLLGAVNGGPDYLPLNTAMDRPAVTVTEVDEGGSVPELKVKTEPELPILIIDGEELISAKQNRVVNTSILLGERDELTIPVSCTEQGRWQYTSWAFQKSATVLERKARARKSSSVNCSLEESEGHKSNQGDVWGSISEVSVKACVNSPTSAMKDVYENRENDLRNAMQLFTAPPDQMDMIVEIDGKIVGLDWLSQPHAYTELNDKLVKSYVLDPLLEPAKPKAKRFLEATLRAKGNEFESSGRGKDIRFKARQLACASPLRRLDQFRCEVGPPRVRSRFRRALTA
tara:strand:- start:4137 stop:5060 length:924 start_codon:yes stop_codon:yes gene_type:complete